MIATTLRQWTGPAALALCVVLNAPGARGADTSAWIGDGRASARLIAGAQDPDMVRAGLQIRLGSGWKTYWRYPGDSGVPPRFDFSGSDNLASVEIQWPAPLRLGEEGDSIIGYIDEVILPLRITPQDTHRPVALHLKLDYAVCEKLCVPAEATLALTLDRAPSSQAAALASAEARVPKPSALGDAAAFAIRTVRRDEANGRPHVVVDIAAPSPAKLFAEGPTADWALPVPQPIGGAADGLQRFAFDLDGLPAGADAKGAVLKLTAVSGDRAIEVSAPLD
jgi:DsbC/DsbD-like thiol-disulfide interchange protein